MKAQPGQAMTDLFGLEQQPKQSNDRPEAAMKVCDRHGDGEAAREQMRQQCLELSPAMQLDLLQHFQGTPANPPNQLDKAGEKQ